MKLEEYGKRIDKEIKNFFQERKEKYHPFMGKIYESMEEYVLREGKRLASYSTLLTYVGYRGKINRDILRACLAIELYRHSILIHDDIVDGDEYRRGGRAFHKIFNEGIAIFSANILYSLSLQLVSDFRDAVDLLIEEYRKINESQVLDKHFEEKKPSVDEWYIMASRRAASLFRACMLLGAVIGNVEEEEKKLIEEIAENIGYVFDIQDDIIGTFASEEEYGRPPGRDIVLGKKPLHVVYAYEILPDFELDDVRKVKERIKECGALEMAKERARQHADRAISLIERTKMEESVKDNFRDFIKFTRDSLEWYKES
ncbi:MAG: polyprenyl synthetase family protein [Candidatus Syntropharchaeia archaeon]